MIATLGDLPLDIPSQRRAQVWAYFWREGLFPQQVEGMSPTFDAEWEDDPSLAMNEVMGLLLDLGDSDVGWLDEHTLARNIEMLSVRPDMN
ncbi:MAG TPA: hypothetical protein VFC09_01415 [Candidatus Dormibacteraeota bacterium]|nr:hypothetical protein [Candidatus Dormibacteraeota bacterium]